MIEVALAFDRRGNAIYWRGPDGCGGGAIEDSSHFWDVLWANREQLDGVAHTHPWAGFPSPSMTDVTTWAAIERALGKRLVWPIVSMDFVRFFHWAPAENSDSWYDGFSWPHRYTTPWLNNVLEMRRLSQGG